MVDMTYFQTLKRLLSVFALVGASVLIPTSIALAHTEIVSTSPAANADVNVSQESISITFSEPPLIDGAAIVVMNEAGDTLDSPAPTLAGATLSIPWPMMSALDTPVTTALPPGDAEISGSNNTLTIVAIGALSGLIAVGLYIRRSR